MQTVINWMVIIAVAAFGLPWIAGKVTETIRTLKTAAWEHVDLERETRRMLPAAGVFDRLQQTDGAVTQAVEAARLPLKKQNGGAEVGR